MSYHTIHNSGEIIEQGIRMTNQCLWISIRDYLRYCRGQEWSVIDIKMIGGLAAESDYEMFDWENRIYRDALERITQALNIRINFFLVDNTGRHHRELYLDGYPIPMHMVNDDIPGTDLVNIAFYGAHFEFIIEGNGIRPCHNINPHVRENIGEFRPNLTVINPDLQGEIKDEFTDVYKQITDNINQIEILTKQMEKNTRTRLQLRVEGQRIVDNVERLQYSGIGDFEKNYLLQDYCKQFNSVKQNRDLIDIENNDLQINIDRLIAENEDLSYVLNALREDAPRDKVSSILVYCHPQKINYQKKTSHFWLTNTCTYSKLTSKPIMDYILDRNNIKPESTVFRTVDIDETNISSPDYKIDGFSSEFISHHKNNFDIVILPDCGGRWWDIINIPDQTEQSFLLYSLIESILTIVKPGGKLYLAKLMFREKVLNDVSFNLKQHYNLIRLDNDLIEITKD